jgi:hypothetical protein
MCKIIQSVVSYLIIGGNAVLGETTEMLRDDGPCKTLKITFVEL